MFSEMVSKITNLSITDARSGFMGFHLCDIEKIAPKIIVERYGIPMELILRLWHTRWLVDRPITVSEIIQSARYGGDISKKLKQKYYEEKMDHKISRVQMAYGAFLTVIEDLKVPRGYILQRYGLMNY
jgi:hypothetical protein